MHHLLGIIKNKRGIKERNGQKENKKKVKEGKQRKLRIPNKNKPKKIGIIIQLNIFVR